MMEGAALRFMTIARILKAQGIRPAPERPTSWRAFLRAHWSAIAGADFFTTEVWTGGGWSWTPGLLHSAPDLFRGRAVMALPTYYTVFVIDLASRRVHVRCAG
ncbi:MAG: hypothetical protein DMF96_15015 [Acidobacteria bacterium]|nr:MAG: hypothetical protein DMF96_15015 [Acidobacteriota bacterium]